MNRGRSKTGRNIGEEKKVKENREEEKDRRGSLFSNYQLYSVSFAVQKVLLHNCIHFM